MQKKTEILCNVRNCAFNKVDRCDAEMISVCCDNCMEPRETHETACKSFRNRCCQ